MATRESRLKEVENEIAARERAAQLEHAKQSLAVDSEALAVAKRSDRRAGLANILAILALALAAISLLAQVVQR